METTKRVAKFLAPVTELVSGDLFKWNFARPEGMGIDLTRSHFSHRFDKLDAAFSGRTGQYLLHYTIVTRYSQSQPYSDIVYGSDRVAVKRVVEVPIPMPKAVTVEGLKPTKRFNILSRDQFKCQLCGRRAAEGALLEVDHKHPRSKGGSDDDSNLWTLCFECNRGKSAKLIPLHASA